MRLQQKILTVRKFFLNSISPRPLGVSWFRDYVTYQKELNSRVARPALSRFCVKQLESFVFKVGIDTFFQVYEFIEGGHDLGTIIDKIRKKPSSLSWHQRIIISKVMLAGIHQLHEQKIAHCDLKPPNLQMLPDSSIEAGYQLKLIDMDFSVLSDKKAPWHGISPYVGTPRYFSPEHLKNEIPTVKSDVFTCGLILYELLGEGHPYQAEDDEEYSRKVTAYAAEPPKLIGSLPDKEANAHLVATIKQCLSPAANERPTAKEVNLALNGKREPSTTLVPPGDKPDSEPAAPILRTLKLIDSADKFLAFNITTPVGKRLLRQFGNDARFADEHQFTIEKRGADFWLIPKTKAPNYTLLNGKPALVPSHLKAGDRIAIGSKTSGKTALPLSIGF